MLAHDALMRHHLFMRTTVTLPDHLYVQARRLAAERKTSLTALLEEGLRALIADAQQTPPTKRGHGLPVMDGGKPRPGVDLTDTSELWEA
jgi:hypothetical protein